MRVRNKIISLHVKISSFLCLSCCLSGTVKTVSGFNSNSTMNKLQPFPSNCFFSLVDRGIRTNIANYGCCAGIKAERFALVKILSIPH